MYYSLKVVVDQARLHRELLTGAMQESEFLAKYQRNDGVNGEGDRHREGGPHQ